MTEVHLPVVGGVSKKALIIGGVASAAVVGLVLLRKRKAAAAAPAAADPNAADPNASDYVDPGLQDTSGGPVYGATGYTDPNSGQWVYGNTGTGQAAATTNAAWAQNAIAYLAGNSSVDTGALAAALGAYLAGRAVTTDQETLIDQAIAAEGYPPQSGPNGYPPGINVSTAGTGAGGTGGTTGGVSGSSAGGSSSGGSSSAGGHLPAPAGFRATAKTARGFTLTWHPVSGAHGYRVVVKQTNGVVTDDREVQGTDAIEPGHPGWTYHCSVQALPGGTGTNTTVTLPRK